MLWTGESRALTGWKLWLARLLRLLVLAAVLGVLVLVRYLFGEPDYLFEGLIQGAGLLIASSAVQLTFGRRQLTEGRYTVTDRRVLVEGRMYGIRVRRAEWLRELAAPELLNGRSVSFGNRKEGRLAGHRASGLPIFPLVLSKLPEPERVLDIVRETHRQAR